jgi:hypothetical protein
MLNTLVLALSLAFAYGAQSLVILPSQSSESLAKKETTRHGFKLDGTTNDS